MTELDYYIDSLVRAMATGIMCGFLTSLALDLAFHLGGAHIGNWNLLIVGGEILLALPFKLGTRW